MSVVRGSIGENHATQPTAALGEFTGLGSTVFVRGLGSDCSRFGADICVRNCELRSSRRRHSGAGGLRRRRQDRLCDLPAVDGDVVDPTEQHGQDGVAGVGQGGGHSGAGGLRRRWQDRLCDLASLDGDVVRGVEQHGQERIATVGQGGRHSGARRLRWRHPDYTVFRPSNGTWYILQSSNGKTTSTA
jgi:hypothetical protein